MAFKQGVALLLHGEPWSRHTDQVSAAAGGRRTGSKESGTQACAHTRTQIGLFARRELQFARERGGAEVVEERCSLPAPSEVIKRDTGLRGGWEPRVWGAFSRPSKRVRMGSGR